ncbi:MAG TPA: uracil-DNA glycosylase family protein [Longimicrobiales bacterium]
MPLPLPSPSPSAEARFRRIFQALHARHAACLGDEWLYQPCQEDGRLADRPIAWSRRNGPWQRVEILWVGAAPGNAGGKGKGGLGAHGTRIPFGGDVAGANLDALFGSISLTRNDTFITATLNQLPAAGGGEPTPAEVAAPVGAYASSLHALGDTLVAAGARLVVALGNVALRALLAAARLESDASPAGGARLLSPGQVQRAGLRRGEPAPWPEGLAPSADFLRRWHEAWGDDPLPTLLWITHPSAQNMSPYARVETAFHTRMLEARAALRRAVRDVLGREPPAGPRPPDPTSGIYALPEWRELVGPRHAVLDRLWREKGV